MLSRYSKIHLIGLGGAGVGPLARVLRQRGHQVSGSDVNDSTALAALRDDGITAHVGHHADHLGDAELVVVSSAVPESNPEVALARVRGVPVEKRAVVVGWLTQELQTIAIAGTHGKTTTTAMTAFLLARGGLDPTVLVGGDVPDLGSGGRLGQGRFLVLEADEYDRSFLEFRPWLAAVTNVEPDHLDYYGSFDAIRDAFRQFLALVPPEGRLVLCAETPELAELAAGAAASVDWYGLVGDGGIAGQQDRETEDGRGDEAPGRWRNRATGRGAGEGRSTSSRELTWAAAAIEYGADGTDYTVYHEGRDLGRFRLAIPGRHNVLNSLVAIAAAYEAGCDLEIVRGALAEFRGAKRRFDFQGEAGGVRVYDDYAHHPTEIEATLAAARTRTAGRVWCVFQPHTYHRTKSLLDDFARTLGAADEVILCPIYMPPGREADTLGISSEDVVGRMTVPAGRRTVATLEEAARAVAAGAQNGDLVLTMGAGDVYKVAPLILSLLEQRKAHGN